MTRKDVTGVYKITQNDDGTWSIRGPKEEMYGQSVWPWQGNRATKADAEDFVLKVLDGEIHQEEKS